MTVEAAKRKLSVHLEEILEDNFARIGVQRDEHGNEEIFVFLNYETEEPYTTYEGYNVVYYVDE